MNNAHNVLTKIGACQQVVLWSAGQLSCESAWLNCERSDWMLWLIRKLDCVELNFYKRYACFCARQNWDNLKDQRSKDGIIAAERYIEGAISRKELLEARSAAYAAACAADAADAAYAADSAAYAADSAADSADSAAYAAAAAAIRQAQADYIRLHVDFESIEAIFNSIKGE